MSKIYLDMNIYNRPFDDQAQVRIRLETIAVFSILQRIKKGDLQLLWSFMLDYENSLNPNDDIHQEIEQVSVLAGETIMPDDAILISALTFEKQGIKPRDALHLACAIKGGADYFLTCDDKIVKRATDLNMKVINPVMFVEETEV
jgi:predicted nucleic acid-binding protein